MKKIMNYVIIFVLAIIILFFALVISSMIPHSAIKNNLKESIKFYKNKSGIHEIKGKRIYSYIHYYADTRKLNIIYCIDSKKPLESVLWSRYYKKTVRDNNKDFIDLIKNSEEPNTQYLRYWNGCMLFLRPLLTIFNMQQIYLLNQILLSVLALILIFMLFKKSKKLAFSFLLSLILVSVWYVSYCIEYSVMFYVMAITSIIAIKIDNNKMHKSREEVDEKLSKLFLIIGVVTTFFDFLTTEILAIFIPLLFILIIRKEENRLDNMKKTICFIIKLCILWFIGYLCMWLAKWILASLILHINAFEYVKDSFELRISDFQGLRNYKLLYKNVIKRNLFSIPIMYSIQEKFYKWEVKSAIIVVLALLLILIDWKKLKREKYLFILLFIGIMPYVRYFALKNHSYMHAMFTFRDQIITIMVILYIIIDCLNYPLLFKEVSISKLIKQHNKNDK